MSKKTQLTDELLDDSPTVKHAITRILWYTFYRELRIGRRQAFEELLKGNGQPGTMLGILNQPGIETKPNNLE